MAMWWNPCTGYSRREENLNGHQYTLKLDTMKGLVPDIEGKETGEPEKERR